MNKSSIIPETDNRKQRNEQSWQDLMKKWRVLLETLFTDMGKKGGT